MIPKIIHYCWFGGNELPVLAKECIASWRKHMPDWEIKAWTEDNFDLTAAPQYVKEAYAAHKYAFVSDYVRLWALEKEGGVYMDVDFIVYKSFEPLLIHNAFVGYEGCKRGAIMMGVIASIAQHPWISEMKDSYQNRPFILSDGTFDLTPNTSYFTTELEQKGLILDGKEKDFYGVHIFPVDYFSPILTSGEDVRSENTYCESKELRSWSTKRNWKTMILSAVGPKWRVKIIKLKRKLLG
jgi:hypothetical protein